MQAQRFDALARMWVHPTSRRAALVGGLTAAVAGLADGRVRRLGLAQVAASSVGTPVATPLASPGASPVASPGPLDLLAGTPAGDATVLGRDGGICKGTQEPCATDPSITLGQEVPESYATAECCSGVCRKRVGRIVVWSCG